MSEYFMSINAISIPFSEPILFSVNENSVISIVGISGFVYVSKMVGSKNICDSVIRRIIECADLMLKTGKRPITVRDNLRRFMNFFEWCELNIKKDAIINYENAKVTLKNFINYLDKRTFSKEIKFRTANMQIAIVNQILAFVFDVDVGFAGVRMRLNGEDVTEGTIVPSEYDQARTLKICDLFFRVVSDNIINEKPFPFLLKMPDYLNWPNNEAWIFPTTIWAFNANNNSYNNGQPMRGFSIAYDYVHGRLVGLEELISIFGNSKSLSSLRGSVRNSQMQFSSANSNMRHIQRIRLASYGVAAFVVIFVAVTGINWAQLTELTWAESDNYEVSSSRQGFRSIKYRANNKEVFFELPIDFMPVFKLYLKLRRYLLGGNYFGLLFFNVERLNSPTKIDSKMSKIYSTLDRLDPDLVRIGINVRQWRASMALHLCVKHDLSTVSKILNNSEETVKKSYTQGSVDLQVEEMGIFVNLMEDVINEKKDNKKIISHVGTCSDYGNPEGVNGNQPSCNNMVGCFCCKNYRVIVDEVDVRKILSARYCLAYQLGQFDMMSSQFIEINKIIERINLLLGSIRDINAGLVDLIESEVEGEQLLDLYWLNKLNMLINLGF